MHASKFFYWLKSKLNRKLKDFDQENREIIEKYNNLNVYGDINIIIGEKEKFENLYKEEIKKNHDQKLFIDTQKRLINAISTAGGGVNTSGYMKSNQIIKENNLQRIPGNNLSFKVRPYTSNATGLF